ncbi:MAG: hypothetical protein QM500_08225 [Methylococcales bacterium]
MALKSLVKYGVVSFFTLSIMSCGGGGSSTPEPPQNIVPTITSMNDESVFEQTSFTYTVSASDSDGSITAYNWQQTAGTEVVDLVAKNNKITFTSPDVVSDEVLTFKVTDDDNASVTANLNITVTANTAPTINDLETASLSERDGFSVTASASDKVKWLVIVGNKRQVLM